MNGGHLNTHLGVLLFIDQGIFRQKELRGIHPEIVKEIIRNISKKPPFTEEIYGYVAVSQLNENEVWNQNEVNTQKEIIKSKMDTNLYKLKNEVLKNKDLYVTARDVLKMNYESSDVGFSIEEALNDNLENYAASYFGTILDTFSSMVAEDRHPRDQMFLVLMSFDGNKNVPAGLTQVVLLSEAIDQLLSTGFIIALGRDAVPF